MILKSFNLYKKCSFDLIDSIPDHWSDERIKYNVVEFITGGTPDSGNESYWCESGSGTPWVSITDMTKCSLVKETEKDVTPTGVAAKGLKVVPKGSILYSIFASLGKVAEAHVDLVTNQAILAFITKPKLNKSFLRYWLLSVEKYLMYFSTSNTQNNLNLEKVKNLPIFIPPPSEQIKIVGFLDHEMAKIDALIEKQQRLIELLKEKRQAVISHAVTKGFNPNAPMKDSRVEWLGEVPTHWTIANLRWFIQIASGDGLSNTMIESDLDQENPYKVIGGNGVTGYSKFLNTIQETFAIGRVGALCGNVHFIDYPCWVTDNALKLTNWRNFYSQYLNFLLLAARLNEYANRSAQPLITGEQVKALIVTIPPYEEQVAIANHISKELDSFSTLMDRCQSAIQMMQERRTALISAAVTGKIDVRDWQAAATY